MFQQIYKDFYILGTAFWKCVKQAWILVVALTKVLHNGATCSAQANFTIPQNVAKAYLYVVNTKFTSWLTQSSAILQLNCNH